MKNTLNVLFIVIAVLTILEYLFICGNFTGPVMMIAAAVISAANAIYEATKSRYYGTACYLIAGIALCMGYVKLIY